MSLVKTSIQRWWRLTFRGKQREEVVWQDLKDFLQHEAWRVGLFEKERCAEVSFQLSDQAIVPFYYAVRERELDFQVNAMESIPPELISDAFILSAHLNNVLNWGKVLVDAENGVVLHRLKVNLLIPFLFPNEIEVSIMRHFSTSKDIHGAFRRLVEERESPAIIFADLLRQIEANSNSAS